MVLEELAGETGDEGHETGERGLLFAVGLPVGLGGSAIGGIGSGDIQRGLDIGDVCRAELRVVSQQGEELRD